MTCQKILQWPGSFRDTKNLSEEIEHGTELQTETKHGHCDAPKIGRNFQPHAHLFRLAMEMTYLGHGTAKLHCPPVQTGLELDMMTGNGDAPDPYHGIAQPYCSSVQTGLELDKKTGNGQKWRRGRQGNYHGGCL